MEKKVNAYVQGINQNLNHANGSYEILREHVELLDEPNYALMVRTTDLEKNNFTGSVKYITQKAYDFMTKPFAEPDIIRADLIKALEHGRLRNENVMLRTKLASVTAWVPAAKVSASTPARC